MEDIPAISFVLCHAVNAQILENLTQSSVDASAERLRAGKCKLGADETPRFHQMAKGKIRPFDSLNR